MVLKYREEGRVGNRDNVFNRSAFNVTASWMKSIAAFHGMRKLGVGIY